MSCSSTPRGSSKGSRCCAPRSCRTAPRLLCVIDAAAGGRVGGTLSAFERWTRCIGPPDVIDLAALRASAAFDASVTPGARHEANAPSAKSDAVENAARPPRMLKTLVFADFAGYSRVQDVNAARFQGEFWTIAARQIAASAVKPVFANTWGDGLFVVFDDAPDGASFALRLSEGMQAADWAALGLPSTSQIRICLHAGPVFRAFDPVIARDNYFGATVTRAARIEPITPPGTVFASEAFAATLAAFGQDEFVSGVRGTGRAREGLRRVARLPAVAPLSVREALVRTADRGRRRRCRSHAQLNPACAAARGCRA